MALLSNIITPSNVLTDSDLGSTVQAYDADTAKLDAAQTFTANQTINANLIVDTNTLYVDAATNRIGIGTTSPQSKLDIEVGSAGAPTYKGKLRVFSNSATADGGIELFPSSFGSGFGTRLITIDEGSGQTPFVIQNRQNSATWTECMRITSAGNVGIGTSSPSVKLHVLNDSGMKLADTGNARFLNITPAKSDGTPAIVESTSLNGLILNCSNTAVLGFYTSNTERMRITTGGNVGIGTSSPTYPLQVNFSGDSGVKAVSSDSHCSLYLDSGSNSGSSQYIRMTKQGVNSFWIHSNTLNNTLAFRPQGTSTVANQVVIDSTGNLGIGTNSPAYKLEVNGSFAATTKSFVIDHPTKPDMKLRYGSLEGPENGVYVRGKLKASGKIYLPDYWVELVHEDSITVNLTPIGSHQKLYVKEIKDNIVIVEGLTEDGRPLLNIECYYTVFAERKDVDKLKVEF